MSNYFKALTRLHRARQSEPAPDLIEIVADTESETAPQTRGVAFPEIPTAKRQAAHAALLDTLRAQIGGASVVAVVLAGASSSHAVDPIVGGLTKQGERRGLRVCLAELSVSHGRRLRVQASSANGVGSRSATPAEPLESAVEPAALEVTAATAPEVLRSWIHQAAAGSDLLLIKAPPLNSSVDAALVAKSCDGLVLVAESLATGRQALVAAVAKARTAGCPILGLVLTETRASLPNWLSRLLGST